MPPDADSPTRAVSGGDGPPSSTPSRRPSVSLQAAATLNAGLQRESPSQGTRRPLSTRRDSTSTDRRRSQVLLNLHIADPAVPSPGEMVSDSQNGSYVTSSPRRVSASPRMIPSRDPLHNRAPSLGELHQELENEQEYQVNRLLAEIRRLQEQIQRQQQQQQGQSAATGDEASDRAVPLPLSISTGQAVNICSAPCLPRSPGFPRQPRSSFDLARADLRRRSRTPSRNASPRLRSTSISGDSGEQFILGSRDESAFYLAETQTLIRENQMLRHRIRELERQLSDVVGANTSLTHEPSHHSHLTQSVSVSEDESTKEAQPAVQSTAVKAD